jgi:hypothetical protein
MDPIYQQLGNFGAVGIIAAIALWQVFALSRKLFSVIENNTKAMTELTILIKTKVIKE